MKPVTYFQELLLNGNITKSFVSKTYEYVPVITQPLEEESEDLPKVSYEQRWVAIFRYGDMKYSITQAQAEEEYQYMLSVCDELEKETITSNYQEVLSCLQ